MVAISATHTREWLLPKMRAGRIEYAVFATALFVLFVHLLDATTLHAQKGAGVGEQALQFAAVLIGAGAAAMLYATSGRAVRGAIAASVGLGAFVAGVAIHFVGIVKNGFGSGDVTGVTLPFAGLALLALGVVMLFRALPKWWYRLAVAPFAFIILTVTVFSATMGTYITHAPRYEITPHDLGRPYEDVSFVTDDGLTISGWYVPSQNGAAVMVMHGSGGARIRPLRHVRMLVDNGYGVLVFDSRGHGESEGTTNALGWGAWRDAVAAARYLEARPDVDDGRIGALGVSMGGEIALDAASRGAGIDAVVSDGAGGRSLNETLSRPFSWTRIPEYALVGSLNLAVATLSGTAMPPAIEDHVAAIAAPTFFISTTQIAEERDLNGIWFDKTMAPKERWEIDDAGHTGGLKKHPEEYESRVIGFFDRILLGDAAR